jgi:hypothetical protein
VAFHSLLTPKEGKPDRQHGEVGGAEKEEIAIGGVHADGGEQNGAPEQDFYKHVITSAPSAAGSDRFFGRLDRKLEQTPAAGLKSAPNSADSTTKG